MFGKNKIIYFVMILLILACFAMGTVLITGCKSTIKIPENLNQKCKITWALIIAFHESNKQEETKAAVLLLLQKAQDECYKSIDKERLRTVSMKCKKEVFANEVADLSDLKKKDEFINCIRINEGEIK